MKKQPTRRQPSWSEEVVIGGRQLVSLLQRLIAKGNVHRLVVLRPSGKVLFQTPLTTGLAVVGVFTVLAPALTALSAVAALLAEVRVKVYYKHSQRD